jgi:hypothetical protein
VPGRYQCRSVPPGRFPVIGFSSSHTPPSRTSSVYTEVRPPPPLQTSSVYTEVCCSCCTSFSSCHQDLSSAVPCTRTSSVFTEVRPPPPLQTSSVYTEVCLGHLQCLYGSSPSSPACRCSVFSLQMFETFIDYEKWLRVGPQLPQYVAFLLHSLVFFSELQRSGSTILQRFRYCRRSPSTLEIMKLP